MVSPQGLEMHPSAAGGEAALSSFDNSNWREESWARREVAENGGGATRPACSLAPFPQGVRCPEDFQPHLCCL